MFFTKFRTCDGVLKVYFPSRWKEGKGNSLLELSSATVLEVERKMDRLKNGIGTVIKRNPSSLKHSR